MTAPYPAWKAWLWVWSWKADVAADTVAPGKLAFGVTRHSREMSWAVTHSIEDSLVDLFGDR